MLELESPDVGDGNENGAGERLASRQPTLPLGTVDPTTREPATPPPGATQAMGSVQPARREPITRDAPVVRSPVVSQKDLPPLQTDQFLSLTDSETVDLDDDPTTPPVLVGRRLRREPSAALPPVRVARSEREPSALHPTVKDGSRLWAAVIVGVIALTLAAAFLLWAPT